MGRGDRKLAGRERLGPHTDRRGRRAYRCSCRPWRGSRQAAPSTIDGFWLQPLCPKILPSFSMSPKSRSMEAAGRFLSRCTQLSVMNRSVLMPLFGQRIRPVTRHRLHAVIPAGKEEIGLAEEDVFHRRIFRRKLRNGTLFLLELIIQLVPAGNAGNADDSPAAGQAQRPFWTC